MTLNKETLTTYRPYIIMGLIILIALVVSLGSLWYAFGRGQVTSTDTSSTPQEIKQEYTETTQVTATTKKTSTDPDVIIKQNYVADVNGKRIEVPVVSSPGSTSDPQGTVTQTINMQPVVDIAVKDAKEKLKKNWEVGAGVMVTQDSVLPLVALQRNFSDTHAVEIQLAGDADGLKGTTLAWKVKF